MGILEETVSIVREAERLVIGPRVNSRWASVDTTLDAVVNMPWFLLAGVQERLATLGFGLLLVPVWWCILTTIMWVTGGGSPASFHSSDGWIVATLMAAGSVIFRLPSRSARLGVRSPQVVRLAAHINAVAADETTIKLLQSGVSALDSAANQRITRINWCLGIGWAGLVWAASHWVFTTDVSNAVRQEAMARLFGGVMIFLFFGIGTMCYETALRIVKQTIDFAFLQVCDTRQLENGPALATVEEG